MATRCNIVIRAGKTAVYIYRRWDGYPSSTGADLAEKLAAAKDSPDALLLALLSEREEATTYRAAKPVYEVTTEIHGDIEWLYLIEFADKGPKIGAAHLPISEHDYDRGASLSVVKTKAPAQFVEFVNSEIRAANARLKDIRARTPAYADVEPQPEISLATRVQA